MSISKKKKNTRKKKKGQLLLPFKTKDERIPKIFGAFLLLMAFYLFIAFTAYLFTWKADQSLVQKYSWGLLLEPDVLIHNQLGKLGAIISNIFIFWTFGLPAFALVFILAITGSSLFKGVSLRKHYPLIRNVAISMVIAAVFLEFIFPNASFPVGGAIGEGIARWLTGVLGTLGLGALFIFAAFAMLIWVVNPTFHDFTFRKFIYDTKRKLFGASRPRTDLAQADGSTTSSGNNVTISDDGTVTVAPQDNTAVAPIVPAGTTTPVVDFDIEVSDKTAKTKAKIAEKAGDKDLDLEVVEVKKEAVIPEEARAAIPAKTPDQAFGENMEPYDPTLELPSYEHPVLSLLNDHDVDTFEVDRAELQANKEEIVQTLLHFKIDIDKIKATIGPTVTLYEIVPAKGVRISKIRNLEDDIALSLSALGIRIIAPIPGRGTIGIEVPNKKKQIVGMKEILISEQFKRTKMELPMALGKTIENEVLVADLAKMPHLLIAGATGQGKSVGINSIIISLLYKHHPSTLKLILIDPKKVELFPYGKLDSHFLGFLPGENESILTDVGKVVTTLNSLTIEMERRYDLLKRAEVRNLKEYNKKFISRRLNPHKGHEFLPYIVLVIDEFADLIMTAGKEIELPLGRLAQLSRAVGIHLIIATQRPSVNIITGVIKANFPARIAFKVASKVDSRTILDGGGAEQLIGKGDMLLSFGSDVRRLQGAFVDTPEVERVIEFIANQPGFPEPFYLPEFHEEETVDGGGGFSLADLDEKFDDAARLVVQNQHGSTSMIQRRMKLGYNRAGRIMDQMEILGIVGPSQGSKPREVLFPDPIELERFLANLRVKKD
ncbi:MAG TPA: DNA translocase FtsK [Saprospiraceae bacterium]|nr:DNA translocase FtsK [Saprospiraceae bacterium]